MKVIGAGYPRTGTVSLQAALETLGFRPCLHPLTGPHTDDLLGRARSGAGAADWRAGLGDWGGALGWVGARHYRELIDLWPDAVVLLTVRDPETWYSSYASCLRTTRELALAGGERLAAAEAAASDALMMLDGPDWKGILDGSLARRDVALESFQRHNDDVARTVPPSRLLVHDVEEGWEPLCGFLGVDVPDAPFPHLNDRRAFRSRYASRRARKRSRSLPRGGRGRPRIAALALADPDRSYSQREVLEALGMAGDPFAERIFASCGVQRRHLGLLDEPAQTLQGRTAASEDHLFELAVRAVDALGADLAEIETVVTASLYSLGGPTLAHRLVEHYQMNAATDKYHVTGVGCASAVPLVRLVARTIAGGSQKGLIVAADTMSGLLSHGGPDDERAKIVGSAIFGDGCAAAIVDANGDGSGPGIVASTVHQIPGTLGAVQMALRDDDSYLYLARELPDLAGAGLDRLVDDFLAPLGLTRHAIDHWLIHPGGRRILDSIQAALALPDRDLETGRDVLAQHGNVGTPSIFYVLAETTARRAPGRGDRGLMVTIGPGVTVGLMLLGW